MTTIITLSGKAESGKDLSASLLKEELEIQGKKVLIINYANYLKFICQKYFNWNGEKDIAGRTLLQQIGTEKVRFKYPNFWVDTVINFVKAFQDDFDYILIPDCRFPNEVNCWKEEGFTIIPLHIERLNYENHLTPEQRLHLSETSMDDFVFDYYIKTETGIDMLREKIVKFVDYLMKLEGEI